MPSYPPPGSVLGVRLVTAFVVGGGGGRRRRLTNGVDYRLPDRPTQDAPYAVNLLHVSLVGCQDFVKAVAS